MISIVIPHWPRNDEVEAALERCVASLSGYGQLVIERNEGVGFAKAVNLGLQRAVGDYICVVNNDTVMERGNLADLCKPDTIVVPRMVSGQVDNLPRAFYCMPRTVYEAVGGYDERFEVGYFEDDDLIRRWLAAGYQIETEPRVEVSHIGGLTMRTTDPVAAYETNKQRFMEKWGISDGDI